MRIKFEPQDKKHPPEKIVVTNIGEFKPGEERMLMPQEEEEGRRLIGNGDFVNPEADAPVAEVGDVEEAVTQKKSKK